MDRLILDDGFKELKIKQYVVPCCRSELIDREFLTAKIIDDEVSQINTNGETFFLKFPKKNFDNVDLQCRVKQDKKYCEDKILDVVLNHSASHSTKNPVSIIRTGELIIETSHLKISWNFEHNRHDNTFPIDFYRVIRPKLKEGWNKFDDSYTKEAIELHRQYLVTVKTKGNYERVLTGYFNKLDGDLKLHILNRDFYELDLVYILAVMEVPKPFEK